MGKNTMTSQTTVIVVAAVVILPIIVLGFGLGFLFDPLSGERPGNPVTLAPPSGTGNCSDTYPPPNSDFFTNASQEQQFAILLMNESSIAKLCVGYYVDSAGELPVSTSIQPKIWISPQVAEESGSPTPAVTTSSATATTESISFETAAGMVGSSDESTLSLTRSQPDEIVTLTISAGNSSGGFYLFSISQACSGVLPMGVGYPASNVSSLNFRQYLSSSSLQDYHFGCSSSNGQIINGMIVGTTGLTVVYKSVVGGPNDTYSSLNSTTATISTSSPEAGTVYGIHFGNVSGLTPGSIFVNTTSQYIVANVTNVGGSGPGPWRSWTLSFTVSSSAEKFRGGTYVITIGYLYRGEVYAKQFFTLVYSG